MAPCASGLWCRSPRIPAMVRCTPHPWNTVLSGYLPSWAGRNIPSFWKEVDGNNIEEIWGVGCGVTILMNQWVFYKRGVAIGVS